MNLKMKIILNREGIIDRLCNNGYSTYIVGGFVRDIVSGKSPKDEDVVTSATPEQIELLFSDQKIKSVGKSFNVMIVNGIEVATFRHDIYDGNSLKTIETASDIFHDLKRRDLTCNAMAFCQYTGDIIDPFGGKEDLKNKIIRFVDDPDLQIKRDINRILRACRFLAQIDGKFFPETFESLKRYSYLIKNISKERIRIEIIKTMKIKKASRFFYALKQIGGLKYIFPSMDLSYNYPGGVYHNETVFEHLMGCGDLISPNKPLLKLAGYLHDIGKPYTYKFMQHRDMPLGYLKETFKGHDKEGSKIIIQELKDLKFSNDEIEYISSMIKFHMNSIEDSPRKRTTRRLLYKFKEYNIHYMDFLTLKLADRKSNQIHNFSYETDKIKSIINLFEEVLVENTPSKLMLNGKEIMDIFNITQGIMVGEYKKYLEELVLDDPLLNKKEILIEKLKEFIEKEDSC